MRLYQAAIEGSYANVEPWKKAGGANALVSFAAPNNRPKIRKLVEDMRLYQAGVVGGWRKMWPYCENLLFSFGNTFHRPDPGRYVTGVVVDVPDEIGVAFLEQLAGRTATTLEFEKFMGDAEGTENESKGAAKPRSKHGILAT